MGLVNLAAIVALVVWLPGTVKAVVASIAGVVMAAVFITALLGGRSR